MSLTRDYRKNPQAGLQTYSKVVLPIRDYLETRIHDLGLKVDIDELFNLESAWGHICADSISTLSRRRSRMKRKEAFDGHIKKPLSSYILYGSSVRQKIMSEQPTLGAIDVAREIGKGWRGLKDAEKTVFCDLAKKERERYNDERKDAYETAKAEGKLYKNSKPKRPITKLTLYMQDENVRNALKPKYDDLKAKDNSARWMTFITKEWEKLNDTEKAKYQKLVDDDKVRYETELAAYEKRFKDYKEEVLPNMGFEDDETEVTEEA